MPRHPRVAPTSESLAGSVFSASSLARRARERGDVHRLHVGDTYLDPPADARVETLRCADHPVLHGYSPVHGEPELLGAVIARHPDLDPAHVQVMAGATGGLAVACQSLISPGDEVLILAPFWPLIRGIVTLRGAVPVEVPFYDRTGDAARLLEAAVTDRTVAVYVNSPNNPLGSVLERATVDAIAEVARSRDLWVLCDEAYESIHFTDEPPEPVWRHPDLVGRAVVTHTLSKSHGIAGLRVGYTHGPAEAMAAVRGVQTFHSYCAGRPAQLAAAAALNHGEPWLAEARAAYGVAARRSAEALGVPVPAGGTFVFFDTRAHRLPGESPLGFLERCVDAGVLLMPGANAGRDYADWARLCFNVVEPDALDVALARIGTCLRG